MTALTFILTGGVMSSLLAIAVDRGRPWLMERFYGEDGPTPRTGVGAVLGRRELIWQVYVDPESANGTVMENDEPTRFVTAGNEDLDIVASTGADK